MGTENWNFLKLLKTITVGTLWFRLGLLSIRILRFLKSDKNYVVMAPKACVGILSGHLAGFHDEIH